MSYTYMEVVNDVLSEMNEVLLTQTTFPTAVNIQRSVKEMVNRAYFDVNNPNFKWPWLAVSTPQDNMYGNAYIETVAGTRWYLLNPASTGVDDDYGHVDYNTFVLTEEGVAGKTAPYTVRNLPYIETAEWRDHFGVSEEMNKHDSNSYEVPRRIIRSPDNRYVGLSPIPDDVYRIYFFAWDRPVKLVNYNDEIVLPDQYYGVLVARARYYAWQRKENPNQAAIAAEEYKDLLKGMKQQETMPAPEAFTDNRMRFV